MTFSLNLGTTHVASSLISNIDLGCSCRKGALAGGDIVAPSDPDPSTGSETDTTKTRVPRKVYAYSVIISTGFRAILRRERPHVSRRYATWSAS